MHHSFLLGEDGAVHVWSMELGRELTVLKSQGPLVPVTKSIVLSLRLWLIHTLVLSLCWLIHAPSRN
jgi:hypothetical protein